MAKDPSFAERLKYWNNDMCRYNPETFDFVVTVRRSSSPAGAKPLSDRC